MQNLIVFLIILWAAWYIGRRIWRNLHRPNHLSCGCGCSGCDALSTCDSVDRGKCAPVDDSRR